MTKGERLSRVRAAAGRAGAASRWGDGPRATVCIRVYSGDAAKLRSIANAKRCKTADVVAQMIRHLTASGEAQDGCGEAVALQRR